MGSVAVNVVEVEGSVGEGRTERVVDMEGTDNDAEELAVTDRSEAEREGE